MKKELFRIPDKDLDRDVKRGERTKVAIVPMCDGAGASYVLSVFLQDGLPDRRTPEGLKTVLELGKAHFYLSLGMDKRFSGREFYDFQSENDFKTNMELGCNWYLRLPGSKEPGIADALRNIYGAPGNLIFIDCSGLQNTELLNEILMESDAIYLVIDPLPSKLIEAQSTIENIKCNFPNTVFVVNKFNKGIHRGELSKFLGTGNYICIPAAPMDKIYRAEFNCVLP